jgi:hypothetical protein
MPPSITQQVFDKLALLKETLELHVVHDEANVEKVAAMYKILVTGNGVPSLPETVRVHEAWMRTRINDIEEEDREKRGFHRQLILLSIGQFLTLAALGFAVWIGWR